MCRQMKIVKFGQDARDALKRGIDLVAKATNPTLGPAGRAAVLGRMDLPPKLADDAISIVMNMESEDPFENEGIKLMRETLMATSKKVKDSTATTMNLSQSVVASMFEKLKSNGSLMSSQKVNTIKLKKELDQALNAITEALRNKARPLTKDETYNVALSAGTYEWIARLVTDVFDRIGVDGYVEIQEAVKTSYEILNGMDIKAGYHSEYYINNNDRECVIASVPVLVTNQPLETEGVKAVIKAAFARKIRQAIIIAPDFTRDTLASLSITQTETDPDLQFTAVALKLPTFDKDDVLIDIATLTGAKFLDKKLYTSYQALCEDIKFENLGTVEKAIVGESKTKLLGGKGDVTNRIKELKDKHSTIESAFDKDILEKRIASLSGGTAFIKIGGVSDFDKGYFKLKLENAVGAVQNALKEGVVPGGGVALNDLARELPANILTDAIKSPYMQIQENNGEPFDVPDTALDPVANTIGALTSACSIAGTLLLTETLTTFKNESKDTDADQNGGR